MAVANHLTYDGFGRFTSQTNAAHAPLYGYTGQDWDDSPSSRSAASRIAAGASGQRARR